MTFDLLHLFLLFACLFAAGVNVAIWVRERAAQERLLDATGKTYQSLAERDKEIDALKKDLVAERTIKQVALDKELEKLKGATLELTVRRDQLDKYLGTVKKPAAGGPVPPYSSPIKATPERKADLEDMACDIRNNRPITAQNADVVVDAHKGVIRCQRTGLEVPIEAR